MDDCISYIVKAYLPEISAGLLSISSKSWRQRVHQHSSFFTQLRFDDQLTDQCIPADACLLDTIRPTSIEIRFHGLRDDNPAVQVVLKQKDNADFQKLDIVHEGVSKHAQRIIALMLRTVGKNLRFLRLKIFGRDGISSEILNVLCDHCQHLEQLYLGEVAQIDQNTFERIVSRNTLLRELALPVNASELNFSCLWTLKKLQRFAIVSSKLDNSLRPSLGKHPSKLRPETIKFLLNAKLHPPAWSPMHLATIAIEGETGEYISVFANLMQAELSSEELSVLINPNATASMFALSGPWASVMTTAIENSRLDFIKAVAALPDGPDFLLNQPVAEPLDREHFHELTCLEYSVSLDDTEILDDLLDLFSALPLIERRPSSASRCHLLSFCSSIDTMKYLINQKAGILLHLLQETVDDNQSAAKKLINRPGYLGMTALHEFARLRYQDETLLSALLDAGADPAAPDIYGRLPLTLCLYPFHLDRRYRVHAALSTLHRGGDLGATEDLERIDRKARCLIAATPQEALQKLHPEHVSTMLVGAAKISQNLLDAVLRAFEIITIDPKVATTLWMQRLTARGPFTPDLFSFCPTGHYTMTLAAVPVGFMSTNLTNWLPQLASTVALVPVSLRLQFAACTLEGLLLFLWAQFEKCRHETGDLSALLHSVQQIERFRTAVKDTLSALAMAAAGEDKSKFVRSIMSSYVHVPLFSPDGTKVFEKQQTAAGALIEIFLRWFNLVKDGENGIGSLLVDLIDSFELSEEIIRDCCTSENERQILISLAHSGLSMINESSSESFSLLLKLANAL